MSIAKFDWSKPTDSSVIPLKVASASFSISITGGALLAPVVLTAPLSATSVSSADLAAGNYAFTFTTLDTAGAPVVNPDGSAIAPLAGTFTIAATQVTGLVVTSVTVSI